MKRMRSNRQRYSKKFYTYEAVYFAIKDYKKIANISMAEDEDYYICTFSECITNPQRVVAEFNNYLIELMNSQGANTEE